MNGRISKVESKPPKDVNKPGDSEKVIGTVPPKPQKLLTREELDEVIRSDQKNVKRTIDFQVSPKLLGLKDIANKHYVNIRDVIRGKIIKPSKLPHDI